MIYNQMVTWTAFAILAMFFIIFIVIPKRRGRYNDVHRSPFLAEVPPELADCSTKRPGTSPP